jgi:hypothetical protein
VEVWGKCHAAIPVSYRGCRGAGSLPHRGGVQCIEVPIEVVAPLSLALDGDAAILTRVEMLELARLAAHTADDMHGAASERECAPHGTSAPPRRFGCHPP